MCVSRKGKYSDEQWISNDSVIIFNINFNLKIIKIGYNER